MKIERVFKFTTPEEQEKEDLEYYRGLTPDQRVDHLLKLIHDWTPESERRLKRVFRFAEEGER